MRTLLVLFLIFAAPAWAVLPHERLADPALEARARALSLELRCQVCQNQSIDDSNAPLAADLRKIVRERLSAGDSDKAVLEFVVRRYGDYVLLRPPMRADTWVLWFGPFAVLAAGALGAIVYLRRRRPVAAPAALSEAEEKRLRDLMERRE
ncbi:MAG: cytochrome c-type biogenesis protein CcmH [Tagaea sp.]|nr:cytochrome c-type biogenesis protein CcmH [Tagaea sp.]